MYVCIHTSSTTLRDVGTCKHDMMHAPVSQENTKMLLGNAKTTCEQLKIKLSELTA
jgi:hypothetical protein